jgi:gamma-glutamylputrescine oxidase
MRRLSRDEVFAADFVTEPIWWSDIAPQRAALRPLPARVDVAVVGSGYCGLSAALELARAGVRVAVVDSGAIGQGASSRNGGMA